MQPTPKNPNPLFSIIMPAYNAGPFIRASIDSVLAQTESSWELIIVNDCSEDNTQSIIDSYADRDARIVPLTNDSNKGSALSRKRAFESATGTYIAFLDADDVYAPEALSLFKQSFDSNPETIAVCGVTKTFDGKASDQLFEQPKPSNRSDAQQKTDRPKRHPERSIHLFPKILYTNPISHPGAFCVRRDSMHPDMFDAITPVSEDLILYVHVAKQGPINLIPKVVSYYRRHSTNKQWSSTQTLSAIRKRTRDIYDEQLLRGTLSPFQIWYLSKKTTLYFIDYHINEALTRRMYAHLPKLILFFLMYAPWSPAFSLYRLCSCLLPRTLRQPVNRYFYEMI